MWANEVFCCPADRSSGSLLLALLYPSKRAVVFVIRVLGESDSFRHV